MPLMLVMPSAEAKVTPPRPVIKPVSIQHYGDDPTGLIFAPLGLVPPCIDGQANTSVTPMTPAELLAQANAATDAADSAVDPNDLGYTPDVSGVDISIGNCADASSYVTTTSTVGVSLNGQVTSVNAVNLIQGNVGAQSSTDQTTQPSLSFTVQTPAILHGSYSHPIKDHSDSADGAVFWVYGTKDKDVRGKPLVYWQNAYMSAGESVNFLSGYGTVHHSGRHFFEDSTPFATKDFDNSTFNAKISFSVEKKDTASAGVELSRSFTVSHSKFGGHRYSTDRNTVYAVDGGYLHIGLWHRNESRQWSQGGAWVLPKGMDIHAQMTTTVEYKSR